MDRRFGYCEDWVSRDSVPGPFSPKEFAMVPNPRFAKAETVDRLTLQLVWFLKAFHEERQKTGSSPETEFWRGNFVGMKRAVFAIYGEAVKDDVLNRLRPTINLPIPPSGSVKARLVFQKASTATQIHGRRGV
jgi:hypothetical protein